MNANANKSSNKASKLATMIAMLATDKTVSLIETRDTLKKQIDESDKSDVDILRKLRLDVCNAESRAARSNKVAIMSDADAATFALFITLHATAERVAQFFARAIYVQDKLRQTLNAIARNTSLSSVTRNNSTRVVLAELIAAKSVRKSLLAALVRECKMSANTASSQVSSSLIALSHLDIITQDSATKEYSIKNDELAKALTA